MRDSLTSLSLVAGFSGEAVGADADERSSGPGHTGPAVATLIHLTVVACRQEEEGEEEEATG